MRVLPQAEESALVPLYAKLRALFERLKGIKSVNFDIRYLSAGMSGDYPIALANGSNMVRIGSKVFGARIYTK